MDPRLRGLISIIIVDCSMHMGGLSLKYEDVIALEARLNAIEHLLIHTLNLIYAANKAGEDVIERVEEHYYKNLSEQTFFGVDPPFSDHMSDEIAQAVRTLFNDAAEMRGVLRDR